MRGCDIILLLDNIVNFYQESYNQGSQFRTEVVSIWSVKQYISVSVYHFVITANSIIIIIIRVNSRKHP